MENDVFYVQLRDHEYKIVFAKEGVTIDGLPLPVEQLPTAHKGLVRARIQDAILDFPLDFTDEGARFLFAGCEYEARIEDSRQRMLRSLGAGSKVRSTTLSVKAPMPGRVVKIEAKVGQQVNRGQGVIVVEAMKMENEVRAPGDGVVKEIRVKEQQTVGKGEVLVVVE